MLHQWLKRALRKVIRGPVPLVAIFVAALCATFLPHVTSAQSANLTTFSSPPPGSAAVSIYIPKRGLLTAGIQVKVGVAVRCGPFISTYNYTPNIFASVSQVDNGVVNTANGTLSPTLNCDNKVHLYKLVATLPNGAAPFQPGTAVTQVSISVCGDTPTYQYVCAQGSASRAINLQ